MIRKRFYTFVTLIIILLLVLQLSGCSILNTPEVDTMEIEKEIAEQYEEAIQKYQEEIANLKDRNSELQSTSEEYIGKIKELEEALKKAEENADKPSTGVIVIPEYNGEPRTIINEGVPFFSEEDLKTTGENYSDLDAKGRCGVCIALVGPETIPTEPRGSMGDIRPSGWDTVKYDGIDGNYLYNRCHLIGWQLTGENDNTKNLITGTRYMNTQGMEPIESAVASYVETTGNHVLYRSTPIFTGDNLLAAGVLLEALSIEDETIRINTFCYNVQPDVIIDYATGKSEGPLFTGTVVEEVVESDITRQQEESATEEQVADPNPESASEPESEPEAEPVVTYVGNANSHKFHAPWCSSVNDMKDRNKVFFYGDRQEVIDAGYEPCKRCKP